MTAAMIQDAIVTLVACGAATILVRRVMGLTRSKQQTACDSCCSSQQASAPAKPDAARAGVHPLKIHLARKP